MIRVPQAWSRVSHRVIYDHSVSSVIAVLRGSQSGGTLLITSLIIIIATFY